MMTYNPRSWNWLVADTGRYWSSGSMSYVSDEPEAFTRIATEAELRDVLIAAGCPERAPGHDFRKEYADKVKAAAVAIRDRLRTPGKDMVYAEKKDQAHAVIAMGEAAANALPNNGAAHFPLLAGTVGIEAPTLYALAQLVWGKYEAWNALSYHIERAEALGVKSISDASDAAAAQAAYEAITWPTLQ